MRELAIVIPYFKRSFFKETLQSLANQTDKRFQVFIGDDASLEDCSDLIAKYSERISIKYHRFETNLGGTNLVAQWERCLAMVKLETWIQILGDDDVVSENFVASFYKALPDINKHGCNVVRFSTYVINKDDLRVSKQFTHPILELAPLFFERKFAKKTRSSLSEYVFKKSVVLEKGFQRFNLAWHTDDMAVFEFSDEQEIFSINEAQVSVRVSDLSITGDIKHLVLKNKATFQFMQLLFKRYAYRFTKPQKSVLLKKMETAYYNIPSLKRWFKVLEFNIKYIGIYSSVGFIFRNFKNKTVRVLKQLHLFNYLKKVTSE